MSRTVPATVATAATAHGRVPTEYFVFRDMRIRFIDSSSGSPLSAPWTQQANPWGATDADIYIAETMVPQDSVVLGSSIVRVAYGSSRLYTNEIDAPTSASAWGNWQNICASQQYGAPGLVVSGSTAYVFYINGSHKLCYRSSASPVSWSGETDTGLTMAGYVTLAPVSPTVIYASVPIAGGISYYRVSYVGGSWVSTEFPWRLYGNINQPIMSNSVSASYFDAFLLNGTEYIIFGHYSGGQTYKCRSDGGVISDPQLLWPTYNDATNSFVPYRVNIVNDGERDVAWLTGRITRTLNLNTSASSPNLQYVSFDMYCWSVDGWNWTSMTRNSFLCVPEVRGQFLPLGDYIYYAGIYSVYRASMVYGINGSDPDWRMFELTDDVVSGTINFPSQGTAPQANLVLAAGKNQFVPTADVIKRGSEGWIYAGYKTSGSPAHAMLEHIGLDSVQNHVANGQRDFQITARDQAFKELRDWTSPLFWDYRSQLKHQGLDSLGSAGLGTWATVPPDWSGGGSTGGGGGRGGGGGGGGLPLAPGGTPVDTPSSGNIVYAADGLQIARSNNFLDASPHWTPISYVGPVYDFALDPWDTPAYSHNGTTLSVMYYGATNGIWKTSNCKSASPAWTHVYTAEQFNQRTSLDMDGVVAIKASAMQQNLIYALAIGHVSTTYMAYVLVSTNGGKTWYETSLGITTNATDIHGFEISSNYPAIVWASVNNGQIYQSSDYGITFTLYASIVDTRPVVNICVPSAALDAGDGILYHDNIMYIGGGAGLQGVSEFQNTEFADAGAHWNPHGDRVDFSYQYAHVQSNQPWNEFLWIHFGQTVSLPAGTYTASVGSSWWNGIYGRSNSGVFVTGDATASNYGDIGGNGVTEYSVTFTLASPGTVTIGWGGQGDGPGFWWGYCTHCSLTGEGVNSYIKVSGNMGVSWTDITPPNGGAITFQALKDDIALPNHITAICNGVDLVDQTVAFDSASSSAWNTIGTAGRISGGVGLYRWPYDSKKLYLIDSTHIMYSNDNGVTLYDKTGDWGTITGPVKVLPGYIGSS